MYQSSSPVRADQTTMDVSSPVRGSSVVDGDTTPRATRTAMRGKHAEAPNFTQKHSYELS